MTNEGLSAESIYALGSNRMTDSTIAQRVAAGVTWADEHESNWLSVVNLDTLDMADPCNCFGGQLHHSFYWFVKKNNLRLAQQIELGFEATTGESEKDWEYFQLTAEWQRVIRMRRGEA